MAKRSGSKSVGLALWLGFSALVILLDQLTN
jgi:hypothetical protein